MSGKDDANLAAGLYGRLSGGERPALLVIDFQRGFTQPGLSPLASDCGVAIAATNRMIAALRPLGPVIFTVIGYGPGTREAGRWVEKCPSIATLQLGTATVELDPRLDYDAENDLVITKTQASAFFGTALAGLLAARSCDSLFIAGCSTSGCVRASTVDALQHGFAPFVVTDCVADRSEPQHAANLRDLESKYAELLTLHEAEQLLSQARAA